MPAINLNNRSLQEIDNLYRQGVISEEVTVDYIRRWNAGPHVMQAVLSDGAIRLFDPDKSWVFYQHFAQRFGLKK